MKQLVDHYGFDVGERGTTDRKLLYTVTRQDTWRAFSEALHGGKAPMFWDRLFFSELVYADIVGRPVEFYPAERVMLYKMFAALRCPVILCLPQLATVHKNVLVEDQMEGVLPNVTKIYLRYKALAFPHGSTLRYDYERDGVDKVVAFIDHYLNDVRKVRQW